MTTVPYEDGLVARPIISVDVSDPNRSKSSSLVARVDTGFDGGILLPLDGYLGLNLQDFEELGAEFVAKSAQGTYVKLRTSRCIVSLDGMDFFCRAFTTPVLLRPLLGMELLNNWQTSLDGEMKEMTIRTPQRPRKEGRR